MFFLLRLILVKEKPQGDLLSEFRSQVFAKAIVRPGESFANILFEYVELYRQIFLDRTYLEEEAENFRFQSLIFIMDAEFKASEWRSCLLLYAKKFGRKGFYRFCLAVEKLFLTHWVGGIRKDERYADYTRVLKLVDNSSNADGIIAEVGGNIERIKSAVRVQNMYGAGYAKYILLRLELSSAEFDTFHLYTARSVEHVHPQTPSSGGVWDSQATPQERSAFVNLCGNLVLLSRGKNSQASNREFPEKKSTYLESG